MHMSQMNQHFDVHNNRCPFCPDVEPFETYDHHREHVLLKHNGQFPVRCKYCPLAFVNLEARQTHTDAEHKEMCQKVCDHCGKSVASDGMRDHLLRNHAEKKVSCLEAGCLQMFATEGRMKSHFTSYHVKVACPHCGKVTIKKNLNQHVERNHIPESEKKFVCKICQPVKGFTKKVGYLCHMNIHTGEKPFKCHLCGRAWASLGNLSSHMIKVHDHAKYILPEKTN